MRNILVDPVLLTVSEEYRTDEQKAEYLQLLDRWAEAASEAEVAPIWHCSATLVSLLQSNGLFPDFTTLQRLQHAYNAVFPAGPPIDIRRIQNWLQRFVGSIASHFDSEFNLTNPAVEARANASQLDVEWQATTFQPEEFAARWHPLIQQQAIQLFARLCACAHLGYSYAPDLHIATKDLQQDSQPRQASSVRVDTILYYLPVTPLAPPAPPAPPDTSPLASTEVDEEIFQYILVFHIFPLLFPLVPEQLVAHEWQWDGTEVGLRAAIEREYNERYRSMIEELHRARQVKQRKKEKQASLQLPFAYTFGSHFIRDLNALSNTVARENLPARFVEAAAAIIANQIYAGSFNPKQLRMSGGGGAPIYRRGKDKAYRIYITSSRGGWRLNYWKGPDASGHERIEFSVIQKEEEEVRIY